MSVREALAAFGTEMRVKLVHYYWRHPGSQVEAAEALGLKTRSVSVSVRALVELGVLEVAPSADGRARRYSVNPDRVAELTDALTGYLMPPSGASN